MKMNFEAKIQNIIDFLTFEAKRFGVKIYFVGGLVRDVIMGKNINDIDILVEGSAIDFVQNLGERVEILSIHNDFNTLKTKIDGVEIDFASTRKEIYPKSGCLPTVVEVGCPISEDLIRRDFTINAIAYNLIDGEIIDLYGGREDIEAKTLRVLHKKSYIDDPTRILRGLDFKLRFGFEFCAQDEKLIREYLKAPDREGLSVDRVYLTLNKLFCDNSRARDAFAQFIEKKYYKILFDECDLSVGKIEEAIEIFKPQNLQKVYMDYILVSKMQKTELKTRLEIYEYFKNKTNEELCVYFTKTQDENAKFYFNELKNTKVFIKGSDLIEMGFLEGRVIGVILRAILEQKLAKNPSVLTFEDEKAWVKKYYTLV